MEIEEKGGIIEKYLNYFIQEGSNVTYLSMVGFTVPLRIFLTFPELLCFALLGRRPRFVSKAASSGVSSYFSTFSVK